MQVVRNIVLFLTLTKHDGSVIKYDEFSDLTQALL